jgi:hypothetical protein
MKKTKIAILPIFLVIATMAFASQTVTYDDAWSEAGFNLNQRSGSGAGITFSIDEFTLEDVRINGEDMQSIILPNTFLQNEAGAPNLPGNGRYLALPQGAIASLRIVSSRTEVLHNVEMAPAPRIPWDTDEGPLDYSKDLSIYNQDAFYPADPVILGEQTMIRGVDAVMVGITPFQYNPVTKELIVYRDIELEIDFIGGNGHFGADNLRSRWWDPILSDTFLNYESLPRMNYNHTNSRDGAEYLIICPDDATFLSWADSIKVFRTMQGISTVIKTTAEVGGNTPTAIENYINDIMAPGTGWDPAPAGILLLGDYGTTGNTVVSPIWNNYCASDNIYADVSGNMMPDVTLARMTAQNATHLETMITKFLDYERTPPTNPDFYDNPVTALGWQTSRWFQICSETVGGFWSNELGKSQVRINAIYSGNPNSDPWSTATNTATVLNVFGPSGLGYIPATPGELGGWTGGNSTMVINSINSGAFMLQHRDHGSTTGWGEPDFQSYHINSLTNEDLVYVFSINCLTGKYNMTGECFAEKFHRHTYNGENAGCLGIVAASEVSYSFVNDTFVWGMYDNMWPEFLPTYGTTPDHRGILPAFANSAGKYFLEQSSWPYNVNNKAVTYALFHHHGDAFSTVYSVIPQNLTIIHDPVLLSGLPSFTVTADNGSLIALSVDGVLIGVGEGTGAPVNITIDPQLPPTMVDIVITKQDYYRYESQIQVIPPGGPYVVFDSYVIDDTATGNSNGILDYGEQVDLDFSVNNVGSAQATSVMVTITSTDPNITIIDGTENFGNIAAGTIVTVNGAFTIEAAGDVTDGYVINFDLEAVGEDTWISYFSIEAHAPILTADEFIINDATGNNNGRLDPGETVTVLIPTVNEGSSTSPSAIGTLTCAEPLITIDDDTYILGEIIAGGSVDAVYTVTADPGISVGTPLNFVYDVDAGAYSIQTNFAIVVGLIVEDFETNNFENFDWQFGGNADWIISTGAYEGTYCAESGDIGDNQTSSLYLEVNVLSAGELSFYKKVSSESSWDFLRFFVDNTEMGSWSGEVSWSQETYQIAAGNHTFKWEYTKDYSWSSGSDCGWVDYIIFPPIGIEPIGIVSGFVTDLSTGEPIENADIEGLAVSGPDGSYSFEILEGTYNLTCTATGYYDLTVEDVIVSVNQTTTVDFALEAFAMPQGLSCIVFDYNDVELTWDVPETTRDVPKISRTKSATRSTANTNRIKKSALDNTRDLTGYKVYRNGVEIAEITDPAILTYTDLALAVGYYNYYITAIYDVGESLPSNIEPITITLPAPQNPQAVTQGADIFVSWDVPANRALLHYKVYRNLIMIADDVEETSYLDIDVSNGTYTYNIRAVYSGGYQSVLSSDAIIEHVQTNAEGVIIPVKTELSGNYPNPFNPTTTIKFGLKEDCDVNIKIYNIKGSVVKTLVDGEMNAAYHEIIWDGKDNAGRQVGSGLYFYKMVSEGNSGRYTSTKKMILLK